MPPGDGMPPDPLTDADQLAANMTELYWAYVKAGMPPLATAVYLGVWWATLSSMNRHEEEG